MEARVHPTGSISPSLTPRNFFGKGTSDPYVTWCCRHRVGFDWLFLLAFRFLVA